MWPYCIGASSSLQFWSQEVGLTAQVASPSARAGTRREHRVGQPLALEGCGMHAVGLCLQCMESGCGGSPHGSENSTGIIPGA